MQSFRSVIFRLFKADADGCSVSRLTRYTSYYRPRQLNPPVNCRWRPRTSNRQTVNKTHWSSTERRLSSTSLCPHSGHRAPLHTPTKVPNRSKSFYTVCRHQKKQKSENVFATSASLPPPTPHLPKNKKRVVTLGLEPKTNGLLDQRSTN
jgi:hypothetical protein